MAGGLRPDVPLLAARRRSGPLGMPIDASIRQLRPRRPTGRRREVRGNREAPPKEQMTLAHALRRLGDLSSSRMEHMERESRSLTPFLVDLLERWSAGAVTPSEVMRAAAERWEPTAWPDLADDDPANAPIVVLELLAHARAWGLAADEVPTLLAILRSTGGNPYERLVEQMAAIDTGTRDLLLRSGYYGPGTEEDPPAWEDGWRDPEQRRLHRGVHQDPDSVWVDARARICAEPADFAAHLLDDLLVNHADAFAVASSTSPTSAPEQSWRSRQSTRETSQTPPLSGASRRYGGGWKMSWSPRAKSAFGSMTTTTDPPPSVAPHNRRRAGYPSLAAARKRRPARTG